MILVKHEYFRSLINFHKKLEGTSIRLRDNKESHSFDSKANIIDYIQLLSEADSIINTCGFRPFIKDTCAHCSIRGAAHSHTVCKSCFQTKQKSLNPLAGTSNRPNPPGMGKIESFGKPSTDLLIFYRFTAINRRKKA
jgi:hypothetical protein